MIFRQTDVFVEQEGGARREIQAVFAMTPGEFTVAAQRRGSGGETEGRRTAAHIAFDDIGNRRRDLLFVGADHDFHAVPSVSARTPAV